MTNGLDIQPVLDFATDYDPASSDRGRLHQARSLLARQIVAYAARCRSNHELMDGLQIALDPQYGFSPPRLLGTGSTRRVWEIPFGLVLKTVRSDPEPRWANNPGYLALRRAVATFTEFVVALNLPLATPRIYGALFAFGTSPTHPAVNISERVEALEGDRDTFVEFVDLFISGETGRLLAKGVHFRSAQELKPTDKCLLGDVLSRDDGDEEIFTENLGIDRDGHYLLIDTGNFMARGLRQNLRTLMPEGLDAIGYVQPEFLTDAARDYHTSVRLLSFYEDFRQRVLRHSEQHSVQD
jgi:hypothetical protein